MLRDGNSNGYGSEGTLMNSEEATLDISPPRQDEEKKLIYPRVSFPYLYSSLSLSASFSCPRHHFISSIATFSHVIRTFPGERKPHTFFNLFFFAMQGGALGRTCDLAFNAQYSSRYINRLSSSRLSLTQKRKGLSSKGFERQRPPRNPANRKIRTDSVIPKPT